jgi:hypothetical protein
MWTLSRAATPSVAIPIAKLGNRRITPIATLSSLAPVLDSVLEWDAFQVPGTITAVDGDTATIALPDNWRSIDQIQFDGQVFLPAESATPAVNTFAIAGEPATIQLRLRDRRRLAVGRSAVIAGTIDVVPTDYVPSSLVKVLEDLPVKGEIRWSESLEEQPSGSLSLATIDRQAAEKLRTRLQKDTELTLFNRGFAIDDLQESLEESGLWEFEVSLTGKWAKDEYNRSSRLRSNLVTTKVLNGEDSGNCQLNPPSISVLGGGVTIAALAAQVGVKFVAPKSAGSARGYIANWSIEVPNDSPLNATAVWSQEAQNYVRQNRCYLDYTNPNAVYARPVQDGRRWIYDLNDLKIQYQGSPKHSPDYKGYAVQYDNWELTGDWDSDDDQDQSPIPRPQWIPRSPKRVTLATGDKDWATPPDETTALKTLSLNWDTSGTTKTLRHATSEDGQPVMDEEWLYGWAYTALQVVKPDGEINGAPDTYWGPVQYKRKDYIYDPTYGFYIGYTATGWRLGRFKTESDDQLETISLSDDPVRRSMYEFRRINLCERSGLILEPYSQYYEDAEEQPAYVSWERCNRDGSSTTHWVRDPTWSPAMFVIEERTYTNSFASMPNPDSGDTPETRLPPLITGEESDVRVKRIIYPSRFTKSGVNNNQEAFKFTRTSELDVDAYVEWRKEDSAQGAGFNDKAVRESFTENTDRPPAATRKPPNKERDEPEDKSGDPRTKKSPKQYEHFVCTPGWTSKDTIGGSISTPSDTVAQALAHAETDLLIRDLQNSISYQFDVPFNVRLRPLDYARLNVQGETHRTRILSVDHTIKIQGGVDGGPAMLTADVSQVKAGIDRKIPITHYRRRSNNRQDQPVGSPNDSPPNNPRGLTIELKDLMPFSLVTRRNFAS